MCFFTPKRPSELPTSLWVSCERLLSLAPTEVARLGPNTLKQLIAQWYQHHPAFAGLPFSAWCSSMLIKSPLGWCHSLPWLLLGWGAPGSWHARSTPHS